MTHPLDATRHARLLFFNISAIDASQTCVNVFLGTYGVLMPPESTDWKGGVLEIVGLSLLDVKLPLADVLSCGL